MQMSWLDAFPYSRATVLSSTEQEASGSEDSV